MMIYKITNLITGKLYIGQTVKTLNQRWSQHKCCKRKSPLTSSLKRYGAGNFKIEHVWTALNGKHLDELEVYFIGRFRSLWPYGYNILEGGNVSQRRGRKPWNNGKKATDRAKLNQSIAHLGQPAWNRGLTTSDDTKKKMSLAKVGKHISPGTEFKKGGVSIFKGKKHSKASLKLIRDNNKMSVSILCVEQNEVFPSIAEAARQTGVYKNAIRKSMERGIRHQTSGLSFRRT